MPPVVPSERSFEEPGSKIWLPYLELADKYDKDLVHNWRDDMDSLLIFAALFSASVTAFVIESYNSLVQDPAEVTVSVLLQISQQIANGTQATAAVRPSFQPATIDVAINILWFLSLAFSLTCALAAVLVRQWARQYLRYPRSFSATSEQARARQFVFENMQWWKMDVVVDMIPALLHISLILFFIGLLLFVRAVSYSLAVYLLCFSAIGGAAYSLLTIIPLIFSACPYKTPFTGFFGLCITTLIRPIWRCTVVLLASLEVFLSQVLSPAVRLWLPSFSIHKRKMALDLSEPVRSAISRSRIYLRERRPSIGDILVVIGSTVTIIQTYLRRLSKLFHERREDFQDDLTIRDAHALRWTMEYSKRDTDLFTIVSSVPEFVQLYDSRPDVHDIMRVSGVTSQAPRLLRLSVGSDGKITNQSAFVSCLESIISVMPCSTMEIGRSGYMLEDHIFLMRDLLFMCEQFRFRFTIRSSLGSVYLSTLSSLLIYCTTALEELMQAPNVSESLRQLKSLTYVTLWIRLDSCLPWREHDGLRPLHFAVTDLYHSLDLYYSLVHSPRTPGFPLEVCKTLQVFRSVWVTSWLTLHVSLSLPHNALTWKSICRGATHLQQFPHSTRASQCATFTIMDDLLRSHRQTNDLIRDMTSAYTKVLFGCQSEYWSRGRLHEEFISRVRVHGSSAYSSMKSGEIVVVTHEQYTKILHNLVSSVHQHIHVGDLKDETVLDAQAHAIRELIRSRLRVGDADENYPFLVDAQHLTAVRALPSYAVWEHRWPWFDLIERTANEFGYYFQLDEDYNIEIHAELQFYEQDLVTWTLPPRRDK